MQIVACCQYLSEQGSECNAKGMVALLTNLDSSNPQLPLRLRQLLVTTKQEGTTDGFLALHEIFNTFNSWRCSCDFDRDPSFIWKKKNITDHETALLAWFYMCNFHRHVKLFDCWKQNIPEKLGQYHCCWCPGSFHCQDIGIHDIKLPHKCVTGFYKEAKGYLQLHWEMI